MQANSLSFPPGTTVRVTDGTARPLTRSRKKLDEWYDRNFLAVVLGKHDHREDASVVQILTAPNMVGMMVAVTAILNKRMLALDEPKLYVVGDPDLPSIERQVPDTDFRAWCVEHADAHRTLAQATPNG